MSIRPLWSNPSLITEWEDNEQDERETYWASLFYDLIIVAGVGAISDPFSDVANSDEGTYILVHATPLLADAALQFAMLILPWMWYNEVTSTFEDESLIGHLAVFVHLVGLASSAAGCVGELDEVYYNLGIGIILARIGLIIIIIGPYMYIDKARRTCTWRLIQQAVVVVITAWELFMKENTTDSEAFRRLMSFIICWDIFFYILTILFIPSRHRLRIHLAAYTDRFKDLTMVIFGEAILSITLSPRLSSKSPHYYQSIVVTLWLIYSLALNEFHILPRPDEHALRRSIPFALAWNYTMLLKSFFLLGVSIGIKRAHYLSWSDADYIDPDTKYLLIYGLTLSLISVVIVRSYSFGWGRHPGPYDPPNIAGLKVLWWTLTTFLSFSPMIVATKADEFTQNPICILSVMGILLLFINTLEAVIANSAASMMNINMKSANNYLGRPITDPNMPRYDSI